MGEEREQYNIGYICTGAQCENGFSGKIAYKFISNKFEEKTFTFKDLDLSSNKVASMLKGLKIKTGRCSVYFPYKSA